MKYFNDKYLKSLIKQTYNNAISFGTALRNVSFQTMLVHRTLNPPQIHLELGHVKSVTKKQTIK